MSSRTIYLIMLLRELLKAPMTTYLFLIKRRRSRQSMPITKRSESSIQEERLSVLQTQKGILFPGVFIRNMELMKILSQDRPIPSSSLIGLLSLEEQKSMRDNYRKGVENCSVKSWKIESEQGGIRLYFSVVKSRYRRFKNFLFDFFYLKDQFHMTGGVKYNLRRQL